MVAVVAAVVVVVVMVVAAVIVAVAVVVMVSVVMVAVVSVRVVAGARASPKLLELGLTLELERLFVFCVMVVVLITSDVRGVLEATGSFGAEHISHEVSRGWLSN
jgi:hypothetical protein